MAFRDGVLRLRVTAAPVEGAANAAVIALLSDVLGIPKSGLAVVRGQKGRAKTVAISGLTEAALLARLGKFAH